MAAIGKVSAVFTASTAGLRSGVNQAAASMRSLEASARSTASGMRALVAINGAQLFGSISSSAAGYVRSLIGVGQAQADVIDRTSKLASRLGMTYGELSGLALAGDLAGVSMDTIAAAATKADVAFVKAANGSKPAIAAFQNLGLSVADLSGMNAADRFEAIASAIADLPTEAERAAAAVALFGRSGAELLPLFNGGAGAIRQAREEAEKFGLALTNKQGQDVEAMNDAFTRAKKVVEGIISQVVAYLSPAVKGVFDTFTNFVANVGGANIGQFIGDGILAGAEYLAGVADTVVANFGSVFEYLSGVVQNMGGVFTIGAKVAAMFKAGFDIGMLVIKLIATGFVAAISLAVRAVGNVLSVIPGLSKYSDGVLKAATSLSDSAFQLADSADASLNSAANNVAFVIDGAASDAGQALVGPWQQAVRGMREAGADAAGQISEAKSASTTFDVKQTVEVSMKEAIKGIDSRSKEGVAEMFRLMRGTQSEQAAERTADAAERTADATEDIANGLDFLAVEF